ncbi:MAG: amidohydrolase family protein [Fimbriimonas ginsengisoli]|uniref:Amidohydrolase family protein n=1 Tax=Fimbriimonas ginsengisoli TaxID=1005039 RepID=A0A931LVS3_FIMGI|nr:amidohydrolase family protein [Fimbriimonas ginsengisoli]
MILRPAASIIRGELEFGLEFEIEEGQIVAIRAHTGLPDPYVLSPAFVNAHSHLEYRGMQDAIGEREYWPWIREITRLKKLESPEAVRAACLLAARENRATGVAWIGEHSDRPYAGGALASAGVRGAIFQEVITFFERETPDEKLAAVRAKAEINRHAFGGPVYLNAHAYHTVDRKTLAAMGASGMPLSIHVAETPLESEFTALGAGSIADFYREVGAPFEATGRGLVASLDDLGLLRQGVQFVHCCEVQHDEIERIAQAGVSVAHCPRSNERLGCPPPPVREMIEAGIKVGLGLDSPASSGPVDFFAEMRCALDVAQRRGRPLTGEQVWRMATCDGAASLEPAFGEGFVWRELDQLGPTPPLIQVHVEGVLTTEDVIRQASPDRVTWARQPVPIQ